MTATFTDRESGTSAAGVTVDRLTAASSANAIKAPVAAISLSNITLSGEQTVDTVACVATDRVLVAGQTDQKTNGIYVVSTGTWQRAPDFDDTNDLVTGSIVKVNGGSNSGIYALTTAAPISLGTSNLTFANILTLIGASSLLAANNLSDVSSAVASLDNLGSIGADIVAASTIDLDAATGDYVTVTGNTGISAVTLAEGASRWVRFTGTPTITVGASLVGNGGGSNITVEAGDVGYFRGFASGVVRFVHVPVRLAASNAETLAGAIVDKMVTPAGLASVLKSTHHEFIDAGAFVPQITNGPAAGIVELTTNKQPQLTLDFDTSTQEYAVAKWIPPKRWNAGTITFIPYWTAASGSGGVVWTLQGVAVGNDDALDVAYGTAQSSTDTLIATGDNHAGPQSSAITLAGTPAKADMVWLRLSRLVSDGSDTLAADAKLLGIVVVWTADAVNDA